MINGAIEQAGNRSPLSHEGSFRGLRTGFIYLYVAAQAPQPPAENESNKRKHILSVVLSNEEATRILESITVEGKTVAQCLKDLPPARDRSEDDPKPLPSPIIKLDKQYEPTHFISIDIPPSGTALNGVSMVFELNVRNGNELTQIIREDGTWIVRRGMNGEKGVPEDELCIALEEIARN